MTKSEVMSTDWFRQLIADVQTEYARMRELRQGQTPALDDETARLQANVQGWTQSLAKADLGALARQAIERDVQGALERIAELELAINAQHADDQQLESVVDPVAVADRINRLADVLAKGNCSLGNIELAHHIDRIECFDDGRVVLRTCRLGALAEAVSLLSSSVGLAVEPSEPSSNTDRVVPRRLTRRRIDSGDVITDDLNARAAWAANPNRFCGLDSRWFEELVFRVPKRLSWAEENATAVAERRKKGKTEEQLAEHFGKSLPTIRASLRIARQTDPDLRSMPRRMPRPRWHEDNALLVARMSKEMGTNELVRHFRKSDVTIRKALRHARSAGRDEWLGGWIGTNNFLIVRR